MGFFDRLFGTEPQRQQPPVPQHGQQRRYAAPSATGRPDLTPPPAGSASASFDPASRSEDEVAIERYRYLLRTAPPETIEQVHAEAFGKLTEQQRQQVLADVSAGLPPFEQPRSTDPQALARAATRAEYMNPGFMERTLGNPERQGPSFGSMVGSSLLGTIAGYVIGSAIVSSFMAPAMASDQGGMDGSADAAGDPGADSAGADASSADASGADASGADAGGWDGGFDGGGMDFGGFDGF
ncbi:MAG TPA: hypothetical protein VNT50_11220 [Microbacterium sp.]|uniref:hypothetical protein n=1 Tax=Microbacterium sp. TaxID=51671 RepID=UPI002BC72449|nr:hypothetical protein [Microbacterium sp.]HWI32054.1 hypothetical protein [Microbacterium sp.]